MYVIPTDIYPRGSLFNVQEENKCRRCRGRIRTPPGFLCSIISFYRLRTVFLVLKTSVDVYVCNKSHWKRAATLTRSHEKFRHTILSLSLRINPSSFVPTHRAIELRGVTLYGVSLSKDRQMSIANRNLPYN